MGSSIRVLAAILALIAAAGLPFPVPAEAALYRDSIGREVELSAVPVRLVSLAPNLTEILFALGLGGHVVGVTSFCDWPPEAREKNRVGGFVNPSIEAVAAAEPDLVLATADGNRSEDVRRLADLGLAVYVVDTRSMEEIFGTIADVGRLTGKEEEGRDLAETLRLRLDRIRRKVEKITPVTVFVALDMRPLISAGAGTFVGEMISLAGGRNVVDSTLTDYPVYGIEGLIKADPEVILSATAPGPLEKAAAAKAWRLLPGGEMLRAVRTERVYELGMGDFFRPGPRVVENLARMVEMLHPGALD